MRPSSRLAALSVSLLIASPSPARAREPDGALAFFAGAGTMLAGFAIGGTLLGASGSDAARDNVGWLTIQSGFALAPLASHAVAGEWVRGLLFAAPPTATLAGTATMLALEPSAVSFGRLPQQRILWGLFGAGLLGAAVGVVDSAFARERARAITIVPSVGARHLGVQIGGAL